MATKKEKPTLFPIKFPEDLKVWCDQQKSQGLPGTQYEFAKQIGVPPYYVTDWKTGRQGLPGEKYLSYICDVLGVDEDRYYPSSHDEKHKYSTSYISKVGKENESFAKEHGLNLELVHALTKLVDFNKLFPKYSPIVPVKSNLLDGLIYVRQDNSDSAVIDNDLKYLQLKRNGKAYTLHKSDLAYLKEIQDQIVDFVEFLFYKRSKEMEDEVEKFNADINSPIVTLNGIPLDKTVQEKYLQIVNNPKFNIPNDEYTDQLREELTEEIKKIGIDTSGTIDLIYPEVTEEFILQHDRFAKYFDVILPKKKKATQKDKDAYFKKGGKNNG